MKRLFALGLIAALCQSAYAHWQAFAFGDLGEAAVKGFVQTPKGGMPGTTSMNRPTLSEAHIHHHAYYDVGAGVAFNDYFTFLEYTHLEMQGNQILTNGLITHAQFIPQGQDFEMSLEFDWYRWVVGKQFNWNKIRLSPLLIGQGLKYHYAFSAPAAASARSFNLAGLSVGLRLQYDFTQHFFTQITATSILPITKLKIFTAEGGVGYHLWQSAHFRFAPLITLGVLEIDYEDNQTIPNHIRYIASPYAQIGCIVSFR